MAVIGGLGIVLFAALFFRLWTLQVVTGDKYLAEARDNQTREITVRAPRGSILDRDGNVLVDNRTSMALELDPLQVPSDPIERRDRFAALAEVLDRNVSWVQNRYREELRTNPPGSAITLLRDAEDDIVYYLQESSPATRRFRSTGSLCAAIRRAIGRRTCSVASAKPRPKISKRQRTRTWSQVIRSAKRELTLRQSRPGMTCCPRCAN